MERSIIFQFFWGIPRHQKKPFFDGLSSRLTLSLMTPRKSILKNNYVFSSISLNSAKYFSLLTWYGFFVMQNINPILKGIYEHQGGCPHPQLNQPIRRLLCDTSDTLSPKAILGPFSFPLLRRLRFVRSPFWLSLQSIPYRAINLLSILKRSLIS